ncbi:MAG TPA: LacI family DNA-binding transcriptional regulator [Solirubrobacteraceae bacterium]|nr:LacI family DNA-binding transcriptional regulator [Solirubrobacteraceae bacterium]
MARLAGVSQPTVSRALRDDQSVSEATRSAVIAAAERLGYIPSQRGRSLATRRTDQVGVVVSDLANPFYFEVLDAMNVALRDVDRRMLVLTPDGDDDVLLARLLDGSLDGAILATTRLDSALPAELARRHLPAVLLNREVDHSPVDACAVDNHAGGRLAAETLVGLGHTRLAALFGPPETSTGRDREAGFREVLAEHGLKLPDARVRRGAFEFRFGREGALALLGERPTALFCGNDVIAMGAFDALRSKGVDVPGEVSVIGFDDIAQTGWEVFRLTTVRQDLTRMVHAAVEMLVERIDGEATGGPRRVVLQPSMVLRATHGPPPLGH